MSLAETALAKPPSRAQPVTKQWLQGKDLPRLTAQQTAFVEAVTSGKHTYTSAYLDAYPTAQKWPRNAVWAAASRMAAHDKVSVWLDLAWTGQAKAINRTAKGHVFRLEQVFEKAMDESQLGAALQAEKAHAEALGHRRNDGEAAVSITIKQYQGDSPVIEHGDGAD